MPRLSQVNAQLEQLRAQRDLLNARLQVAAARARVLGGRMPAKRKPSRQTIAKFAGCAGLIGLAICVIVSAAAPMIKRKPNPESLKPTRTAPGDRNRFSAEFLFGQEIALNFDATCIVFDQNDTNPNRLSFCCGSDDGIVRTGYISKADGRISWHLELIRNHSRINVLTCSPNNSLIASGHEDGLIRIWDQSKSRGKELIRVLVGHSAGKYRQGVNALKFNSDSTQLLSAGGDGTMRLWDVLRERELKMFQLSSDLTLFASADRGKQIILAPGLVEGDGFGSWDRTGVGPSLQFFDTEITMLDRRFSESEANNRKT